MSGELRVMSGEGRGESKQPRSGPFTATANSPLTPHPSPLTPYSSPLAPRRGFSLLELQVAFVLFGIALAGLGPLVVMQSRQLQRLAAPPPPPRPADNNGSPGLPRNRRRRGRLGRRVPGQCVGGSHRWNNPETGDD